VCRRALVDPDRLVGRNRRQRKFPEFRQQVRIRSGTQARFCFFDELLFVQSLWAERGMARSLRLRRRRTRVRLSSHPTLAQRSCRKLLHLLFRNHRNMTKSTSRRRRMCRSRTALSLSSRSVQIVSATTRAARFNRFLLLVRATGQLLQGLLISDVPPHNERVHY
jgi:hypothetical protein